jgi:hypothetical protein
MNKFLTGDQLNDLGLNPYELLVPMRLRRNESEPDIVHKTRDAIPGLIFFGVYPGNVAAGAFRGMPHLLV